MRELVGKPCVTVDLQNRVGDIDTRQQRVDLVAQFDQAVGFVQLIQTSQTRPLLAFHAFDAERWIAG